MKLAKVAMAVADEEEKEKWWRLTLSQLIFTP